MDYNLRVLSLFLVLSTFYLTAECGLHKKMTVHIMNGLPDNADPLSFRCQSFDDDLGYHTLRVGEEFHWKFRNNFIYKTLFFCTFHWKDMSRRIDVYNDWKLFPDCDKWYKSHSGTNCYWMVKEDGFYSSTHKQDPKSRDGKKIYDWKK